MCAGQLVLLIPPKSSHPRPLLSRQQSAPISPLSATLMNLPTSVANKRLTQKLSPLDSALTKNTGVGGVMVNQIPPGFKILVLSFQALTNCPFRKSFVLTFMHRMGGVGGRPQAYLKKNFSCERLAILLSPQGSTSSRSTVHSSYLPLLQDGDDFDFDQGILREARDLHGRSRGRSQGEIAGVHFVHRSEIVHVLQEDRRLDDVIHLRSGGLHDPTNVFQDPFRLFADIGLRHLARFRIQSYLSRDEQETVRADGLRIRSNRFCAPVRQHNVSHRQFSFGNSPANASGIVASKRFNCNGERLEEKATGK